jgi:hypothetical protein
MFTHERGLLSSSVAKYGVVGYGGLQAFSIMRPTCVSEYVHGYFFGRSAKDLKPLT